jgi:hypothetical protein
VLSVADNCKHYPTKQGYLRVPTMDGDTLIPCYYTSTLLQATMISPDAAGKALHCQGYTSVSLFDDSACNVTLRHCRRTDQDVLIPATLQRGLLFTDAVIMPTKAGCTGARPPVILQVSAVSLGEHKDVHSSTPAPASCPCTVTDCGTATDVSSVVLAAASWPKGPSLYQRLGFQPDVSVESLIDLSVDDTGIFPLVACLMTSRLALHALLTNGPNIQT